MLGNAQELWGSISPVTRNRLVTGATTGLAGAGAISLVDWLRNKSKKPLADTARNLVLGTLAGGASGLGYDQWYRNQHPIYSRVMEGQAQGQDMWSKTIKAFEDAHGR